MNVYSARLVSEPDSDMTFNFVDYGEMMGFVGTALENGRLNNYHLQAIIEIVEIEEVGLNE